MLKQAAGPPETSAPDEASAPAPGTRLLLVVLLALLLAPSVRLASYMSASV